MARRPARGSDAPFHVGWAALLAVGAGLVGVLAFPRVGWWPMAFMSVAGLSVAVHGRPSRTGAWLGWLYGIAFFGPLLHWTSVYVGAAPWLVLALAEAAFLAALGAVLPVVQRLRFAPCWVAATWVLEEAVRARVPFGGFPWGRLAFSQAESPLRWFATLGGAPLVSFAVAIGGAGLADVPGRLAARGRRPYRWPSLVGALSLVVAVPLVGAALAWPLAPDNRSTTTTVALVQGGLPELGLVFESRAMQVLNNHVAETMKLVGEIRSGAVPKPSLVVWPENSSDVDPLTDPTAYAEIQATVKALGVPLLVGAILPAPGNKRLNVGILWSPTTGPGAEYVKRHPVPFGEYIPLRKIAKLFSSDVNLVTQDMVAGHGNGLLTGGPYPIGDVICFEVAYDSLVRSSVVAGARLLVVQTNNATFGRTAETYQQLAMSQLRAVESGRTVLQVSTTGMSAVIGPNGTIRQRSGALFAPDLLVASVPLESRMTPSMRIGPLPEYVLCALDLLAIAFSVAVARRRGPQVASARIDSTEEKVSTWPRS